MGPILASLVGMGACFGQNLVPNSGFEDHRAAFQYLLHSDTSFATTPINCWVGPTRRGFTYNHYQSAYDVPVNLNSSTPHTGNGWLMLEQTRYSASAPGDSIIDSRHYAQTKLIQPLVAGQTYQIKMYVYVMYRPFPAFPIQFSYLNNFGIHFDSTRFTTNFNLWIQKLHLPYQVNLSNFTYNVDNWTEIITYYTALGGERYITIGNFDYASQFNLFNGPPALDMSHTMTPLNIGVDDISIVPLGSVDYSTLGANLGPDTTICADSVNMTLTAAAGFEQYVWNTGDTTQTIQITQPGTYWVSVDSECNFCSDTIIVSLQTPLHLEIGNDTIICGDEPFLLPIAPNLMNLNQYTWSNGATTPQINVNQAGEYILNAGYVCGILSDTIVILYQPKPPAPIFFDTSICLNSGDYQPTAQGLNLQWYDSGANGNLLASAPSFSSLSTDTFFVWVSQTINTCESDRYKITTAIIDAPVIEMDDYALLCEFNEEKFGPRDFTWDYFWNDGFIESPRIFHLSGFYQLTAQNQCGEASDWIEIEIEECPCTLFFPESFTPNNDGINDGFQAVYFCEFEEYEISIYNRWGERIFLSTNPNDIWTPNTRDVQQAVYVLKYSYKGENRERVQGTQKLVLLR